MKVGDCVKIKYPKKPFFDSECRGLVLDILNENLVRIIWLNNTSLSFHWSIGSLEVCDFPPSDEILWVGVANRIKNILSLNVDKKNEN